MRKTRISIIGAGPHARAQHYPPLAANPEVELISACDVDAERIAQVRDAFGVPEVFSDYREMIRRVEPDGVVVVMKPMELTEVALGCLAEGVHLMIEKPPGCTSMDTRKILDAAREKRRKVMVSLNRRFVPMVRRVRRMAEERGGVLHASATYNKNGLVGNAWTWPSCLALADGIHLLDLLRFLCGPVAEVYAGARRLNAAFMNTCSGLVVFESGALGSANNHQSVGGRVQRLEVHAEGLSAFLDLGNTANPRCELLLDGRLAEPPSAEADEEVPEAARKMGLDAWLETRHFVRWIRGEEDAESDLADVIESVRLCEAIAAGHRGPISAFDAAGFKVP